MSNYYAPCSYRIGFVVIPSYIELPWFSQTNYMKQSSTKNHLALAKTNDH